MASQVDICNLALGLLGDVANVTSINPPDASAQAGHCARFFPMAVQSYLERHSWGFATLRTSLALSTVTSNEWQYVYVGPPNVANYLAVYDPNSGDQTVNPLPNIGLRPGALTTQVGTPTPQPFVVETDAAGDDLIYTNQQDAMLLYTSAAIFDPTKWSPLFTEAVSYKLASFLAGPLIKGQEGRQVGMQMGQMAERILSDAINSDANQRRLAPAATTPWVVNR